MLYLYWQNSREILLSATASHNLTPPWQKWKPSKNYLWCLHLTPKWLQLCIGTIQPRWTFRIWWGPWCFLPGWRQCISVFFPVSTTSLKYSDFGNHCPKHSLTYRRHDWHHKFPGESGPWFLCPEVMRRHTRCNEILADRPSCTTTSILSMSVWIWTKSNLESTNRVTHWHQTCCLCREPLLKMCLSPGAVRSPALSQSHPGVTGHGGCGSASHIPFSFPSIPGPVQIIC